MKLIKQCARGLRTDGGPDSCGSRTCINQSQFSLGNSCVETTSPEILSSSSGRVERATTLALTLPSGADSGSGQKVKSWGCVPHHSHSSEALSSSISAEFPARAAGLLGPYNNALICMCSKCCQGTDVAAAAGAVAAAGWSHEKFISTHVTHVPRLAPYRPRNKWSLPPLPIPLLQILYFNEISFKIEFIQAHS